MSTSKLIVQKQPKWMGYLQSIPWSTFICFSLYNPRCSLIFISYITPRKRQEIICICTVRLSFSWSPQNPLYDFEDSTRWNNIVDGLISTKLDPTIILGGFCLPNNDCNVLTAGISKGTTNVFSDGYFYREPPIGS